MRNVLLGCYLMFVGGLLAFSVGVYLLVAFAFASMGTDFAGTIRALLRWPEGFWTVVLLNFMFYGLVLFVWGFKQALKVDKKPPKET